MVETEVLKLKDEFFPGAYAVTCEIIADAIERTGSVSENEKLHLLVLTAGLGTFIDDRFSVEEPTDKDPAVWVDFSRKIGAQFSIIAKEYSNKFIRADEVIQYLENKLLTEAAISGSIPEFVVESIDFSTLDYIMRTKDIYDIMYIDRESYVSWNSITLNRSER
jgi:hypothetical protein